MRTLLLSIAIALCVVSCTTREERLANRNKTASEHTIRCVDVNVLVWRGDSVVKCFNRSFRMFSVDGKFVSTNAVNWSRDVVNNVEAYGMCDSTTVDTFEYDLY